MHVTNKASDAVGDDLVSRAIRRAVLRAARAEVPGTADLLGGTYLGDPRRLRVGERCFVNRGCYLDLAGSITLQDDVTLGHGVSIITAMHSIGPSTHRAGDQIIIKPVTIEVGAWLGANVTVLPGVRVGAGAIVAAGAVVTRDVPPNVVVAGVPARVVKTLNASVEDRPTDLAGR